MFVYISQLFATIQNKSNEVLFTRDVATPLLSLEVALVTLVLQVVPK